MHTIKESVKLTNVNKLPEQTVDVEVTLPDNLQEAIQDAGSEDRLVEVYSDSKTNRAKTAARNVYRNAAEGSVIDELIERVKAAASSFSFVGGREPGVKAKAQKLDSLKAMLESGQELTREQLLAMLK